MNSVELIYMLDEFSSRLSVINNIHELILESGKILHEMVDVEHSGMFMYNEDLKNFQMYYSEGFTDEEVKEAERTAMDRHPGWVFKNKKILKVDDVDNDPTGISIESKRSFKVRSRLWTPVVANGNSIGAFGLSSENVNHFNDEHVAVMSFIANLIGVVYLNIQHLNTQQEIKKNLENSLHELKSAKDMKEKFLANMSHEIRTPLNAINGMIHLFQDTKLSVKQTKYLDVLNVSSDHLLALLNDLLDLSKIEAGQLKMEMIPFSLKQIIDKVQLAMIHKIKEKNLSFHVYFDTNINEILLGDPTRIMQVFVNLVSNAFKFTTQGHISIHASLKFDDNKKQELLIVVKDSGIGIETDKHFQIFESFKQEDESVTRKYGGSGLGLTITKEIIQLMGGEIWLKSEKDVGSEFSVKLSFDKFKSAVNLINPIISIPPVDKQIRSRVDSKILIVDDDEINIFYLKNVLVKMGFKIDIALNGKLALNKVKNSSYNLILMDVQMPEMDGLTATRFIREELHDFTPIIAITANAIKDDYERCINSGMNDYVSKPININKLKAKILEWVDK